MGLWCDVASPLTFTRMWKQKKCCFKQPTPLLNVRRIGWISALVCVCVMLWYVAVAILLKNVCFTSMSLQRRWHILKLTVNTPLNQSRMILEANVTRVFENQNILFSFFSWWLPNTMMMMFLYFLFLFYIVSRAIVVFVIQLGNVMLLWLLLTCSVFFFFFAVVKRWAHLVTWKINDFVVVHTVNLSPRCAFCW